MNCTNFNLAGLLVSAAFGLSTVAVSFETANARGHGHHGARHHAHQGGHHGRPHHPGHRPGNPGHRPGGGGHQGGGHHHHHNNDHWHHHHHNHGHHDHWNRLGAGVWAGAAAAAAIGSIIYSLPPACRTFYSGNVKYWECGGVYYQAAYQGPNLELVRFLLKRSLRL